MKAVKSFYVDSRVCAWVGNDVIDCFLVILGSDQAV